MVVSYLETHFVLYHLSNVVKITHPCVVLNYLSSTLILKLSPVVNAVILVNQTKEIWRGFTRFAIISKPNIQIKQNKNPVEANYIAYHIIVKFFRTGIQLSQKKMPL